MNKVDIQDVAFIYSATKAETEEQWENVIGSYRATYWREAPNYAEYVARYLINNNLVIQPRLNGRMCNIAEIVFNPWLNIEDFNSYVDRNEEDY